MAAWYKEPTVSWFYVKNKEQCGPVQFDGLTDLYEKGARGGGIDDGTLLWSDRMSGWMKIKVRAAHNDNPLPPALDMALGTRGHARTSAHSHLTRSCPAHRGCPWPCAPPLQPLTPPPPQPLWSRTSQSCTRCYRTRSGDARSRRGRRPV